MTDIVTPTAAGADVQRECGCVERLDPDWDTFVIVSMCFEHTNLAAKLDYNLPRLLGQELDQYVAEAAGGHRVQRLRPRDESKR